MNVPVIAIKCGIDNEFFLGGELHKFAEAVIEEYKASLVPVAWLNDDRICAEIGYESTCTTEHPRDLGWTPLYALPKETK